MSALDQFLLPESAPELPGDPAIAMPQAIEVEKTILGAILRDPKVYFKSDALFQELFYLDSHKRIFVTMQNMLEKGIEPDVTLVYSELNGDAAKVGGISYLSSLQDFAIRGENIDPYIQILKEKQQFRQLIAIGDDLSLHCMREDVNPAQVASDAEKGILRALAGSSTEKKISEQSQMEFELLLRERKGDKSTFIPSGITVYDEKVGGYAVGELTVIGGRPQQGKSCTLAQAILANCPLGNFCHIFSIEMRSGQLLRRLWAAHSGVAFRKLRRPEYMSDVELTYVSKAMGEIAEWPLLIDDAANLSATDMVAKSRVIKRKNHTKFIGIDYLQKMNFSGRIEQRFQAVTEASVALAGLAKAEQVSVVLLSSVTEKSGSHRNEPPTLQNLRMSGDIQYEASTVLLIHRAVDENTEQVCEDGQLIIAKARSDASGAMDIHFNRNSLLFE